jgi:hypothetical protein
MTRHRQEVVLASHNAGKLAELQTLFDGLGWRLRSIAEFDLAHRRRRTRRPSSRTR